MQNRLIRKTLWLLLMAIFLVGCATPNVDPTETSTTTTPTQMGVETTLPLESTESSSTAPTEDPNAKMSIDILPWDSDRTKITSGCMMAETENGYYFSFNLLLYYADKSDLSNWVIVCTDPTCTHPIHGLDVCEAMIDFGFQLYENRLYYCVDTEDYPELYPDAKMDYILTSTALDGTDRRVEFASEDLNRQAGGGFQSVMLPDRWLVFVSKFNADGGATDQIFSLDASGQWTEVFQVTRDTLNPSSVSAVSANLMWELFGDGAVCCSMPNLASDDYYRITEDGVTLLMEFGEYMATGSYLSGDELYYFESNKGYFKADLTTDEVTKLAEPQLENSAAYQLLEDCILEGTLLGTQSTGENRANVTTHAMKLYDGENWFNVPLPEELQDIPDTASIIPMVVTSDRILLPLYDSAAKSESRPLYQILLTNDKPILEFVGRLPEPKE